MINPLAWLVVLLLVGPPLLILGAELALAVAAVIPGRGRRIRETFRCPYTHCVVTADFLVAEGAPHPSEVQSCSAFRNPSRVTCKKACREVADVRWGLPRGLFPRWALTADGPVAWREVSAPGGVV